MPTAKCPTFLSWIIQGSVQVNNFGNAKATNNVNAKKYKVYKAQKNVFCNRKKGQVKVNAQRTEDSIE
jgi:hypothetical protein